LAGGRAGDDERPVGILPSIRSHVCDNDTSSIVLSRRAERERASGMQLIGDAALQMSLDRVDVIGSKITLEER
jgi:hypothetical protein